MEKEHTMTFVTVWDGFYEERRGCDWNGYHESGWPRIENIQPGQSQGGTLDRVYIESPQGEEISNFYDADNDVLYENGHAVNLDD